MAKQYINQDTPVYISYSRADYDAAQKLCALLREKYINIVDGEADIKNGDGMSQFEKEIGESKFVVIFVSEKYFMSRHCMSEYASIMENTEDKKIFVVKTKDMRLNDDNFMKELLRFWGGEKAWIYHTKFIEPNSLSSIERTTIKNDFYLNADTKYSIFNLRNYLSEHITYRTDDIIHLVDNIVNIIYKKATPNYNSKLPDLFFVTRNANMIVPRDKEADWIKKKIDENQIINLIGMGGCGKTTLSEYFVNKYRNEFQQITGVFINGNFYHDITNKFAEIFDTKSYNDIIAALERYPKQDNKYNLFIIDINETADYEKISIALDNIVRNKRLFTWKILVVSRVKIHSNIIAFEPNNVTNIDFSVLKGIFFHYLTKEKQQYCTFSDNELVKLFNSLYNLPLLVEQLAYFLNSVDKLSISGIFDYLGVDESFINGDFAHGKMVSYALVGRTSDYDNIGYYLGKLIVFSALDTPQQTGRWQREIVRHLSLWPAEYYSTNFIATFISEKNCDKTKVEREIQQCLNILAGKCIVNTKDDNGVSKYQLSGLIAEAIREQIFEDDENVDFRNYGTYLNNVDEFDKTFNSETDGSVRNIIAYSFANYIPFDEEYLLQKARLYTDRDLYQRALAIKALKLKQNNISDSDIYRKLNSYIRNTSIEQLYYNWHNNVANNLNAAQNQTIDLNGVKLNMVYVDSGTFQIGSYRGANDELPVHTVTLNDYYISETQVTQKVWNVIMGNNPSYFKGDNLPVESVSWFDCINFIMELNKRTGLNFRLPTEAEWEFAAKGGNHSKGFENYSGGNYNEDVAWFSGNSQGQIHPVKMKISNELGLYDMSGNVWEWCQDYYGDYSSEAVTNPTGRASGAARVLRGGSWNDIYADCRMAKRFWACPEYRDNKIGFRLVLPVNSEKGGK